MISGKGILYTVLAASGAALLVGSMVTGGKRREPLQRFGNKVQNMLSKVKQALPDQKGETAASQMDQLGPMSNPS